MESIRAGGMEYRRMLIVIFVVWAAVVLLIGLGLSWFVHNKSLSTVGMLQTPSDIKLMGPNATEMAQIDLSYDPKTDVKTEKDEVTGADKKVVHLTRPFCVKTDKEGTSYNLLLARTTNISGLKIRLYKAKDVSSGSTADATADVKGVTGINSHYAWNKDGDDLIPNGHYINKLDDSMLADTDHDYQTFDKKLGENQLQRNASPVYWKANWKKDQKAYEPFSSGTNGIDNYIIELSWPEDQNETDIIYLIANSGGATSSTKSSEGATR